MRRSGCVVPMHPPEGDGFVCGSERISGFKIMPVAVKRKT